MEGSGSGRLVSADIYKGVAIFAIAVMHLAIPARSGLGEMPAYLQFLYMGLMGFFIMSGYFFRSGRGFRENMRLRIVRLFVALLFCAVVLTFVCYLWCLVWGQPTDFDDLVYAMVFAMDLKDTGNPLGEITPWPVCGYPMGFYFLWTMIGAFVIFYGLADRVAKDRRLGIVLIAILVAVTVAYKEIWPYSLPFSMHLMPMAAAFMFAGQLLAGEGFIERVESAGLRSKGFWGVLLFSVILGMVLVWFFLPSIKFDWMDMGVYGGYSAVPYLFEGILAFSAILCLSYILSHVPIISTIFTELGRHSLGILLLHCFVAKLIMAPFYTYTSEAFLTADFSGLPRLALALVSLTISYLICRYGMMLLTRISSENGKCQTSEF